jgi:hypothetical protein
MYILMAAQGQVHHCEVVRRLQQSVRIVGSHKDHISGLNPMSAVTEMMDCLSRVDPEDLGEVMCVNRRGFHRPPVAGDVETSLTELHGSPQQARRTHVA